MLNLHISEAPAPTGLLQRSVSFSACPFAVFTLDVRLLHIFKARNKPIFPHPSLISRSDNDLVHFQSFGKRGTGLAKNTATSWLWGNIRIASDPSTGVSNVENRRGHIPVHNFFRSECRVLHVCPVGGAHHRLLTVSRPTPAINTMVWPPHLLELL